MARSLTTKYDPSPYWRVVEVSLIEIHGLPRGWAKTLVSEFRARLTALPPGIDGDIIYHDEEFNVACRLAGRNLSEDEFQLEYDEIIDRHYPGWRTQTAVPSRSA